jgi:hypothetical protein
VTDAVMVWVPRLREEVLNEAPLPIEPLIDEVQARLPEIVPSSTSVAVPLNETEVPTSQVEPLAGAVMLTAGGL